MRRDGSIERWDELNAALQADYPIVTRRDQRHRTIGSSSVSRFWHLLALAFKEHQSWFMPSQTNPRILFFPFARYIEQGMKIRNLTTGTEYRVVAKTKHPYLPDYGDPCDMDAVLISGPAPPEKWHRLQFEEDKYIDFVPANPRAYPANAQFDNLDKEEYGSHRDTVTYFLRRREAGSIDSQPFGRHRERKPRFRSIERDVNNPLVAASMHGQVFDNIAQFDCWALSATESDRLTDYFEQFMSLWTGVLTYNGIEKIWYWSRGMDAVQESWRNAVAVRSLQYYFRTEDVDVHVDSIIRSVSLAVGVTGEIDQIAATGLRPVTGQLPVEIQEN